MKTKQIFLSDINFKRSPKVRYAIEPATVLQYAEAYQLKRELPPVVLFWDEAAKELYLADGMHRCVAHTKLGRKSVEALVHNGTYQQALEYALLANTVHGLPRSQDDKMQCIVAALNEWPKLSNNQIAKLCDVDEKTVIKYRKQMEADGAIVKAKTLTASDGSQRPAERPPRKSEVPASVKKAEVAPEKILDYTKTEIPKKILKYWNRTGEIHELTSRISSVINVCKQSQREKDIMYAEVNFSGLLSDLERAWHNLKLAVPYAVCPTCQGHPETQAHGCRLCFGKGLISEFKYKHTTPVETKKMREGQ